MTIAIPDWALFVLTGYLAWDAICNAVVARARKKLADETLAMMDRVGK